MRRFLNVLVSALILIFLGLVIFFIIVYRKEASYLFAAIIVVLILNGFLAFAILVSNRALRIKLSWIFTILALPIIGAAFFSIFGFSTFANESRKNRKKKNDFAIYENYQFTNLLENDKSVFKREIIDSFSYAYRTAGSPVYLNNKVKLICEGPDFEKELINLIRNVEVFLHIQYYIINKSEFFTIVVNELIKKANSGVKIRIIYDWIGSLGRIDKKLIKKLKSANIDVAIFNLSRNPIHGGTNFRAHRKVIIADNKFALTGGSNIGDEYLSLSTKFGFWRDTNILVEGEIVNTFNTIFANDWQNFTKNSINKQKKNEILLEPEKYFKLHQAKDQTICQVIQSGPNLPEKQISDLLLKLIVNAKKRVWLTTPYLLPSEDLIGAIRVAALSGIDVRIITPGFPDNKAYMLKMTRNEQYKLLQAGVKFYEYQSFIHSKTAIFDDDLCIVGTYNIDYRSLLINFESATLIGSSFFVQQMESMFQNDFLNSILITSSNYKRKGVMYRKLYLGVLSIFYPLL